MQPEKFEKLEYLMILKKILDLENPVDPDKKKDKNIKSLLEIIEEDNDNNNR